VLLPWPPNVADAPNAPGAPTRPNPVTAPMQRPPSPLFARPSLDGNGPSTASGSIGTSTQKLRPESLVSPRRIDTQEAAVSHVLDEYI
jgi:hypothetical protein